MIVACMLPYSIVVNIDGLSIILLNTYLFAYMLHSSFTLCIKEIFQKVQNEIANTKASQWVYHECFSSIETYHG